MTQFKQFLSTFERYAYGQSLNTAFTDLLDWILLPFKMHTDAKGQQKALETYSNHPKVKDLLVLITMIGDLSEDFGDPLGELYMQAISNGHNGQYFTPSPICDMLALMSAVNHQDGQTVLDCACGSGRMLLAAAKLNRSLKLYGADLDINCCKMALINMLLNSLTGEIAQMNSLSNEFYVGFKVETTLVNVYHMPYYKEFNDSQLSTIWLKPNTNKSKFDNEFEPIKSKYSLTGTQGSLF